MKSHDYYRGHYERNLEIRKLKRIETKKKYSLVSKLYGYSLIAIFMISVSMLDSVSWIPTIICSLSIVLGTVHLYLGGHLNG